MYQSTQLWTPGNEQVDGARGNTRAALRRKSWHVVAWYHGDRNDGPCTASLPHSGQCHPLCCHPKRSEPDLCLQLSYHVYARSRRLAARPQPTIPPSCPRRPPWNWCSHTKQTTAMLLDQRSRPLCALCSCRLRVVVKSSVFFLVPLIKQLAALAAFEKRPSHGPACAKVYFLDIICCCHNVLVSGDHVYQHQREELMPAVLVAARDLQLSIVLLLLYNYFSQSDHFFLEHSSLLLLLLPLGC